MTKEQAIELVKAYQRLGELSKESGAPPELFDPEDPISRIAMSMVQKKVDKVAYLEDMGQRLLDSQDEYSERKIMRWLGFMQGVLWAVDFYSIDDVKEQSRAAANDESLADALIPPRRAAANEES